MSRDRNGQTESARPNRPDRNGQTEKSSSEVQELWQRVDEWLDEVATNFSESSNATVQGHQFKPAADYNAVK